jgi:hypothetical protein
MTVDDLLKWADCGESQTDRAGCHRMGPRETNEVRRLVGCLDCTQTQVLPR